MDTNKVHIVYDGVNYYKRINPPYIWYWSDGNISLGGRVSDKKRIKELEICLRRKKIEKLKSKL